MGLWITFVASFYL